MGVAVQGVVVESELGSLLTQIIGVIVTTIAIGLLLPLATDTDGERPVKGAPRGTPPAPR